MTAPASTSLGPPSTRTSNPSFTSASARARKCASGHCLAGPYSAPGIRPMAGRDDSPWARRSSARLSSSTARCGRGIGKSPPAAASAASPSATKRFTVWSSTPLSRRRRSLSSTSRCSPVKPVRRGMPARKGTRADFQERGSTMARSKRPRSERARARRVAQPNSPCPTSRATASSTSGMRSRIGSDQPGATTPMRQPGWSRLSVISRLWAIIMSSTQEGPTTRMRSPRASPGPPEGADSAIQPLQVFAHPFGHGAELAIVAGLAQAADIGAGVALVAPLELVGEVDVLDAAAAVVVDHRLADRLEGLGAAAAQVEDAGCLKVIEEPEVHADHIAHVDEVAALHARLVAVPGAEQLDAVAAADLGVVVIGHAGHLALVLLPGAVDVEVAEAHHLALELVPAGAHVLVEEQLGVAVDVERLLVLGRLHEHLAAAVGGRRGGVEEGNAALLAEVQQPLGVLEVVVEHEAPEHEKPLNVYGYSKLLFDQYVRARWDEFESQVVGFRYFNVYGPREQHKGKMASVAYHHHTQIRGGDSVKLFGAWDGYEAGMQSRDFVYVGDVVSVNLWFLDNPQASGIFNLGSGRAEPFKAIGEAVIDYYGRGSIEYVDFPDELKGRYQSYTRADIGSLRQAGYDREFRTVAEGVREYLEWLNG